LQDGISTTKQFGMFNGGKMANIQSMIKENNT
jgi:hypothetical protein